MLTGPAFYFANSVHHLGADLLDQFRFLAADVADFFLGGLALKLFDHVHNLHDGAVAKLDGVGHIEASVHCAYRIRAEHGDRDPAARFCAADRVRLRRGSLQRSDSQCLRKGFRFVGTGGNCEAKRTAVGRQVSHAAIRFGSLRSKGPADFGSGEGYLGRMAVVKDGLSAQDRADDQIRQEKNCGDSQGDCMDEL